MAGEQDRAGEAHPPCGELARAGETRILAVPRADLGPVPLVHRGSGAPKQLDVEVLDLERTSQIEDEFRLELLTRR